MCDMFSLLRGSVVYKRRLRPEKIPRSFAKERTLCTSDVGVSHPLFQATGLRAGAIWLTRRGQLLGPRHTLRRT